MPRPDSCDRATPRRPRPRRSRLVALALGALVLLAATPARADDWPGLFGEGWGFFFGGGPGGALSRTKQATERKSRYAAMVPVSLRAGFDIGKYGLAILIDGEYAHLMGPSIIEGPDSATRRGRMDMYHAGLGVMWRPISSVYIMLGSGVAFVNDKQTMLRDPSPYRPHLTTGLGFVYRFPRKAKGSLRKTFPIGMTFAFESRVYPPFDEHFMHYTIQVVLNFFVVITKEE